MGPEANLYLASIHSARDGDILVDKEVRGLQLRVRNGRKIFYLYYRTKSGQRRRPKLGEFPGLNLIAARAAARELLAKVALGGDPSLTWHDDRRRETVNELIDRYLCDYCRPNKRTAWRESQQFDTKIRPRWGRKVAAEISKEDVLALKRDMADIPVTFNRIRALLSHMFNFAEIDPNPVKRVTRYRERQRRRYLSGEEFAWLSNALAEEEERWPHAVAFLRLLLLTGCRSGELLNAKWTDYSKGVLTLHVHKTSDKVGPREIYFPPSAQAIVENLERRNQWLCGIHVRPTVAIDRIFARAGLEGFVPHDIRHTFASEALSAGFTLDQIGELLGHTDVQTTRRYAHLIQEQKRAAAVQIANQVERRLAVPGAGRLAAESARPIAPESDCDGHGRSTGGTAGSTDDQLPRRRGGRGRILSPALVSAIRKLHGQGVTQTEIAGRLGVSRMTIWRYLKGAPTEG